MADDSLLLPVFSPAIYFPCTVVYNMICFIALFVGVDIVTNFCQCQRYNVFLYGTVTLLYHLYRKGDPPLNVLDLSTCTIQTLGKLCFSLINQTAFLGVALIN